MSVQSSSLVPELGCQLRKSTQEDLAKMNLPLIRRILFQIFLINDFEHAVLSLQADGCVWGPAHTSVGQEAVAVAACAALGKTDKITGSHRSHHHFLAKVMNWVLPDEWDPCECEPTEESREVVRRTLAEIMGILPGYCGGRGGSMHLRHVPAGVMGTNGIVGGGIPIASGVALAEYLRNMGNVVICFFGDGAANQGTFHESANIAGIWRLPIIYLVENNLYAVGTRAADACAVKNISDRASSYCMTGITVDGNDPVAMYGAVSEAVQDIRLGERPYLIEAKCYRRYHHAGDKPGSTYGYRTKEEEVEWASKEAVVSFPKRVVEAMILNDREIACLKERARALVDHAVDYCTYSKSPRLVRPELWPKAEEVSDGLRSDGHEWNGIMFSEVEDFSEFDEIRYSDAISAVTGRWLERDPEVFVIGEEVANFGGGAYGATRGLPQRFPDRLMNTPISEAGFVGMACGAALAGMKPVVEIMYGDFALVAADQLFSQIAKTRHMYGGKTDIPLVARTRVAIGCGYGGQHSMDPVALYALFPGWRIVYPSNAFDYVGLFNSAMRSLDPVIIIEHHSHYPRKYPVPKGNLDYYVEFGKAKVIKEGSELTIVTYGACVDKCAAVHKELAKLGISAEVIDLRTVDFSSIDYSTMGRSVCKTGLILVVEEAPASQSLGATIASVITERFFDYLDAPVSRVTSADIPNPASKELETAAITSEQAIMSAAAAMVNR